MRGRPRGKRKKEEDYDENFAFEVAQDTLGVQDSGEESEKENEKEKEAARAKRKLYQKKLQNVSYFARLCMKEIPLLTSASRPM